MRRCVNGGILKPMNILIFGNSHVDCYRELLGGQNKIENFINNNCKFHFFSLHRPYFPLIALNNGVLSLKNSKALPTNIRNRLLANAEVLRITDFDQIWILCSKNRLWVQDYVQLNRNLRNRYYFSRSLLESIMSSPVETPECDLVLQKLLLEHRSKVVFIGMAQRGKALQGFRGFVV